MTMSHKTVQARVNNSLAHPFETNVVLKQDWLALLLSNLALEQVRNLPVDTKAHCSISPTKSSHMRTI